MLSGYRVTFTAGWSSVFGIDGTNAVFDIFSRLLFSAG